MSQDPVTEDEVHAYGWNSIEFDNPTVNMRVISQQLYLIGRLLLEIRDKPEADPRSTEPSRCRSNSNCLLGQGHYGKCGPF